MLFDDGQNGFHANLSVFDNTIEGWAAWRNQGQFEVMMLDGDNSMTATFDPDCFHPLASEGAATSFSLPRPKSAAPLTIVLSGPQGVFRSLRIAANDKGALPARCLAPTPLAHEPGATVIVPIYADYEATQTCLDGLLAELSTASHHRALLVNDATPDRRIAGHLAALARSRARVEVLTNPRNLGFIGSINRALSYVTKGDVILLRADTIVPAGFIPIGLAAAARSSADVGTVTPLSNNGEFTSFPIANVANPLNTRAEVERIDGVAATANAGVIVDIPSGIGFCLYVTRACLDAVGYLSEDYYRGYLEDVDFCLRARERGFRNVCAPSVYVGHAGSKSFGAEKRSLVVRNLEILKCRFPTHRAECEAFTIALTLCAPARGRIRTRACFLLAPPTSVGHARGRLERDCAHARRAARLAGAARNRYARRGKARAERACGSSIRRAGCLSLSVLRSPLKTSGPRCRRICASFVPQVSNFSTRPASRPRSQISCSISTFLTT